MEVIIKGNDNNVKKFLKLNSLWMKRNGISVVDAEVKDCITNPTAKDVAELIDKCTSLEELEQYKSDERQVVGNAYKKKLKELE